MINALDRRAVMLGTAAAALAPAVAFAIPTDPSPLADLIEAHRQAHVAFCKAIDALSEAEETQPEARDHFVLIPIRPGVSLEWSVFRHCPPKAVRDKLRSIRATAEVMPDALRAAVEAEADRMEREALDAFERAAADFEAKRRAHGVAQAAEAHIAAMEAEDEALENLCRYRPRDMEELRTLAAYLASRDVRDHFSGMLSSDLGLILVEALAGVGGEART